MSVKTFIKSKKQVKESSKAYPKTSSKIGCGCGLAGKICRHNSVKLNKSEFIKDFRKSYDWKEVQTTLESDDQKNAENASPELIQYIKTSIAGELSKIPFAKGMLTISKKADGLYSGFFQDQNGQVVANYDSQTPEMIAKNMEVKELYSNPNIVASPAVPAPSVAEPEESGKKVHIKIKYGNFELEIKKSIYDFTKSFKDDKTSQETSKSDIRKAISFWRRNSAPNTKNDFEAAKNLLENWETQKESFNQTIFVIEQLKKSKNG